jgi:Transposase, Mutator family/Integrase core domain
VGAARHERTPERSGYRNGYRRRDWDTRVGTVELEVPRVRDSSYFPSLLEPRRRAERALAAVVQEAYVHGVSTRKVDGLVKALGMTGISKSRVSELCEELDEEVARFRDRPLEGPYPYVWLDATYLKARQDGRVASVAVMIAIGVNGRTGTALDNAMAESFIATLKTELLVHRHRFPDREVARSAIFEYLEGFYNRRRLHSALSYRSPADYEEATMEGVAVA